MKLSEFIADAKQALEQYGDLPVIVPQYGCGCCWDGTFEEAIPAVTDRQVSVWQGGQIFKIPAGFVVE